MIRALEEQGIPIDHIGGMFRLFYLVQHLTNRDRNVDRSTGKGRVSLCFMKTDFPFRLEDYMQRKVISSPVQLEPNSLACAWGTCGGWPPTSLGQLLHTQPDMSLTDRFTNASTTRI